LQIPIPAIIMQILHDEGDMRLDWLEDLVALLDSESLTEAAQRRNVSQPAFTRRVRAAEETLGADLLDRSQKPARLRSGVQALAPQLRGVVSDIRQLKSDLRLAASAEKSSLVITSQHSLATTRATAIVERLDGVPAIDGVRLRSANRDDCIRMIIVGEADIALVHRTPAERIWNRSSEIEMAALSSERFIPVATPLENNQLSHGRLRLIGYPVDVFLGQVFAASIAPHLPETLEVRHRAETALAPAAHALARESAGVAWLPETMVRFDLASGRLNDLSSALPSSVLELVAVRTFRPRDRAHEEAWNRLFYSNALDPMCV
jgi:DNA-binding transcriptional LysR family regulator